MKVCFFAHYSTTNQDGATLSMYNIIEEMLKRNIEIVVVTANTKNLEKYITNKKIKFICLPYYGMRVDLAKKNYLTNIKFYIKSLYNKYIKRKIEKELKNEKIDVIHINGLDNPIGAEIANKLKIPYVWHIRQFLETDLNKKVFREKYLYKLVNKSSSIIAISKDVKNKFEPIFKKEMDLVYNGVPTEKYLIKNPKRFQDKVIKLFLAGRISSQKGQMEAIKAIELLKQKGINNLTLTLVGTAETKEYLQKVENYINSHNLNNIITILEHHNDLLELRKVHDIGLICSKREAFGRVTVENMLANMLVIGANSGGTAEIINNKENGLLYEAGNYQSLADCIEYSINNKEEMKKIIKNGYNDAINKYSISRVVDQIIEIYNKIIS